MLGLSSSMRSNPLFTGIRGYHIVTTPRDFGQDPSKLKCADSQVVVQGGRSVRESRLVHVLNDQRVSLSCCLIRLAYPSLAESRETVPIKFADVLPSSSDLANVNGPLKRYGFAEILQDAIERCGFAEILQEAIERCSCTKIRQDAVETL